MEGLPCCPEWKPIEAGSIGEALESALNESSALIPILTGCQIMAYVGEDIPNNKHPNGKPICVHGFVLNIGNN